MVCEAQLAHLRPLFPAGDIDHHPTFTRSGVIVLTDKQTDAAENIQPSRYATTLDNISGFISTSVRAGLQVSV